MSLRHIMLGLLSEPQSGYDIKKQFEKSLKNFWNAELSQIYPLLQKMEKEGLLKSKKGESDIGPTKRVYKRTTKGSAELRAWLGASPVVGAERIGYLAQIYFLADVKDKSKSIAYMRELRDYMANRLAILETVEREWAEQDPGYPDALSDEAFYPQLTLVLGIRKFRTTLEWCDECIARIHKRTQRRAKAG